jgi:hypothetical protein
VCLSVSVFNFNGVPRNFFGGEGSTNSVEDRGQRGRWSWCDSPLIRGSAQLANEWNPLFLLGCSGCISTEQRIRLGFVKISEFRAGWGFKTPKLPLGTPLLNFLLILCLIRTAINLCFQEYYNHNAEILLYERSEIILVCMKYFLWKLILILCCS